jgi:iron complex transport system substrate-binding protein
VGISALRSLACLACACACACASPSGSPQPSRGRPERVVSLSPAVTEALFAVGCGGRVVLRDGWSDAPPEALAIPAVTGFSPSPEAILDAQPDLVIVSYPAPALTAALNRAGVRVAVFAPRDLDGVAESLRAIGELCGEPERGLRLERSFRERVDRVRERVSGSPRPRVFYEMDAVDPARPFTVGRGSFGHAALEAAGAVNVFSEVSSPWFQVDTEAILAADPDLIVLGDADAERSPVHIGTVGQRRGWSALGAVRSGRIVAVPKDLVDRPGPRLADGIEALAALLHPGLAAGAP